MKTEVHPFWQVIRTVPNFPKQGIDFYDITPLLYHDVNGLIDALIQAMADDWSSVDCLVAVEARGFVLASLLSGRLGKPLLLVRKMGKLPPPVYAYSYDLEYGSDTLEMADGLPSSKVLIVDDVLATGGTLKATVNLCQQAGHQVLGALVLLDLVNLHSTMNFPVYTVLTK